MLLQEGSRYSFSQIAELDTSADVLLAELGYRYRTAPLSLPAGEPVQAASRLGELRAQMRQRLPHIPLTSVGARRALYITPLLFAALDLAGFRMHIDRTVVGRRLLGTVDYLLRGARDVVVAAAEGPDIRPGFTQLAAQMVAVSEQAPQQLRPVHAQRARKAQRAERARSESSGAKPIERPQMQVFGAITNGVLWRFGILERARKTVIQDTGAYHLPRDLEQLFRILVALPGVPAPKQNSSAAE